MNGVVNISIGGVNYPLKFGMQSVMVYTDRCKKNLYPAGSKECELKVMIDLFYAGLYGHSLRNETEIISFAEASDLYEQLLQEPDFVEQSGKMWKCYIDAVVPYGEKLVAEEESKKKTPKKAPSKP